MRLKLLSMTILIFISVFCLLLNDSFIKKAIKCSNFLTDENIQHYNRMDTYEIFNTLNTIKGTKIECIENASNSDMINATIKVDDVNDLETIINEIADISNLSSISSIKISKNNEGGSAIINMHISK